MKATLRLIFVVLFTAGALCTVNAQSIQAVGNKAATTVKPATSSPAAGQERVITMRNSSEKAVAVFAGPKEEIRNPRIRETGGMSTNTLYLHPNDVVCLMADNKKPTACVVIKEGTSAIEINSSATGLISK